MCPTSVTWWLSRNDCQSESWDPGIISEGWASQDWGFPDWGPEAGLSRQRCWSMFSSISSKKRSPAQVPPEAVTVWGQKNSLTDGGWWWDPFWALGRHSVLSKYAGLSLKRVFFPDNCGFLHFSSLCFWERQKNSFLWGPVRQSLFL